MEFRVVIGVIVLLLIMGLSYSQIFAVGFLCYLGQRIYYQQRLVVPQGHVVTEVGGIVPS